MTGDLTASDKRKLADLARSLIERAQLAGSPPDAGGPDDDAGALPSLALHQDWTPQAAAEFAAACRRQVEAIGRQVTRKLDAMLLMLERFEAELTALQGEVDGLRTEQQEFVRRLDNAEEAVRSSADELVAQVSDRFRAHLERVDRAAAELMEGRRLFAESTAALLDRLQH
jgi:hypothetical protein